MEQTITLAHGAGGKQTNDLIGGIFKKYFDNKIPNSGRCGSAATSNWKDGDVHGRIYRIPCRIPWR